MKRLLKLLIIAILIIYVRDIIINEMDKHTIIKAEKNNSIILNVQAKPIEFLNGCVPASVQTIIKYVTKKEISQKQLGQKMNYNPQTGTQLFNAKNVLNQYLSNYLKEKYYLYKYFHPNFGKTTQEQILFFKMIYYSLKNNFPVHFAIHGYLNKYYYNNFINHAVVLNGYQKADRIENYTYYISDNNTSNKYITFKSSDLPTLFQGNGEINYYSS